MRGLAPHSDALSTRAGTLGLLRALRRAVADSSSVRPACAVAVGYYLAAHLGLAFTLPPRHVSPLWFPNAILCAALLSLPRARWRAVLLAAGAAHLLALLPLGTPLGTSVVLYLHNCTLALLVALGMRRFTGRPIAFAGMWGVACYLAWAVAFVPMVTALAVTPFLGTSTWETFRLVVGQIALSNALANATLTPVLVLALGGATAGAWSWAGRHVELIALGCAVLAAGIFDGWPGGEPLRIVPPEIAPTVVLLWAAARFGVGGTSASLLGLALLGTVAAAHGGGPYVRSQVTDTVFAFQLRYLLMGIPALALAAGLAEREEVTRALRASEANYRAFFTLTTVGAIALDPETGVFLDVNDAFCHLTGYTREQLLGMPFTRLTTEEDRTAEIGSFGRFLASGTPASGTEKRVVRRDGTVLWVQIDATLLRDAHGRPTRAVGIVKDVTERRRSEETLRESEARFRGLAESGLIGIIVGDAEGRIVEANDAFLGMIGRTRRDLEAGHLHWDHLTPPQYAALDRAAAAQLLNEGVCRLYEKEFRTRDGGRVPVLIAGAMLPMHPGRAVCCVLDLSERKRTLAAVQRLSARLLAVQDDERRRLARDLHDVTAQNLFALTLHLAQLERRIAPDDAEGHELLTESRMLGKQVLDEIRSMSYVLHPPLLDETGLPNALRWYVEGVVKRSGVQIDLTIPPDMGRPSREIETALFRVVQECLSNIVRHSGSTVAQIELARVCDDIVLRVTDCGHGMAPRLLGNLDGAAGDAEHLGVGIPGMRQRVRDLGGQLSICSNERGTTVVVTIPAVPEQKEDTA